MGEIHIFRLKTNWRDWDYFIETGTGQGESLIHAKSLPFKELISFEIHPEVFDEVKHLQDERTQIINCSSVSGLRHFLPYLDNKAKIFFWLDAHFPGADFGKGEYRYDEASLPLYRELEVIQEFRKDCEDYICIDDVQLYDKEKLENFMPNHRFSIKRLGEYYGFYER